jgi:hypothetical protein
MIRIITNNLGSGDWVVIKQGDNVLFEGHRPNVYDMRDVFESIGILAGVEEVTDQQMEEGAY